MTFLLILQIFSLSIMVFTFVSLFFLYIKMCVCFSGYAFPVVLFFAISFFSPGLPHCTLYLLLVLLLLLLLYVFLNLMPNEREKERV